MKVTKKNVSSSDQLSFWRWDSPKISRNFNATALHIWMKYTAYVIDDVINPRQDFS